MQTFAQLPRITLDISQGTVDAIPDERLRELAHYWFARRHGNQVPSRADIDPLDFPALLPNIMLLDRVTTPEGDRFRFRLSGTDIALYTGRELTGKFLDEVLPATYHEYVDLLNRTVLKTQLPIYTSSLYHDEGNFVNGITYRVVMPLRSSSLQPDRIFVCQFWQRREDRGSWTGNWLSAQPEIRVLQPPQAATDIA
ncbi:PAS domain-containing protein [Ferrovibrio terrae]|uniref:PAS domain-containing protein n=1 Tax=Ferrovibrio terrae TaxID=2594003 RepID=UPI00313806FE